MTTVLARITRFGAGAALAGIAAVTAAGPALAQTTPSGTSPTKGSALADLQAKGTAAIAARQAQLTKLAGRLAASPSCDTNGAVAAEISADGPALTALGQKLAADTTAAQAKTDFQTIFDGYRVYMVVTPQAYVTAACGKIGTVTTRLSADESKLAARVSAAAAAGADMAAAQTSLSDMSAKIADASTRAAAAASTLASIAPDKGNKATVASNKAAVASAHSQLVGAHADLVAAVADAKSVVGDLRSVASAH